MTLAFQGEIDRIARECTETAARRDAVAKSIKEKEQVQAPARCNRFRFSERLV
jgi:hypothetical protein